VYNVSNIDRPSFLDFLSSGQKKQTGLLNYSAIFPKSMIAYIQKLLRSVPYNVYPVFTFSENVDFRISENYGGPIRTKSVKLY
jgi:hypothetical protein